MENSDALALSAVLLAAAGELTRRIHEGVVARGFEGVRPVHGFAFARIAGEGASVGELAGHLGVTKQAASQMVEELVRKGYVERRGRGGDGRVRVVVLTALGWACTRAAEEAAAEVVREWGIVVGEGELRGVWEKLGRVVGGGVVRPVW
ncbi:MarR family transcriptional regulator [Streptomyces acidiscabies]|uniref:Helix-turn-helix domain-containing protein n=3 Tax=Streptomyces acidiscabies TaxID=42234 RepID=A0AAP6EJJ8_9ACTN|nr:helix-turn-helix domain-containing protein [Streptomyces acidiscabies]MBP5940561.1 MarR family transcriptional regulator [Streptomyces sp. LBUM 1476]MBZ3911808.1 MarR family transcriptional regulator [Streptomyces acidiscabies]MDX2964611.1 helix-turn-helix domain-containing protein [Streptomyces acidiscabies]MDX3024476.1 helix-turn-helix domain-containing protein [Streptomyces acidiscabies]MDX3794885.1 helix-turn-helix domain-containing protein [Streptomyces acidiscabies]